MLDGAEMTYFSYRLIFNNYFFIAKSLRLFNPRILGTRKVNAGLLNLTKNNKQVEALMKSSDRKNEGFVMGLD